MSDNQTTTASETQGDKPALSTMLANPRGFCAGVERAITMVEQAIRKYGAPIYVRHQIVHNQHVVERLEGLGAIFVKELTEVPENGKVIFSAHGVPKKVPEEAKRRELIYFDATCPLVSKVHRQAEHLVQRGYHILLIGHDGHPEVVGTMGQVPKGVMTLIETVEDIEAFEPKDGDKLAFITQTTLSVDDTASMVEALITKFPDVLAPKSEDICYATTNRQEAIKSIAKAADLVLVVGAANSSNSNRLVETARDYGAEKAELIADADAIDWSWFEGVKTLGISAGASAPEILVEQVLDALDERFNVTRTDVEGEIEDVFFRIPRELERMTA
ncbi:MAG: 4-hydroxy-3-methylbut-2-enyl diphosphate reductase [Alphaproteobacteria bacterium]|nr:4-hydroxy-3-methylbut-2-enyl diphosphate reductase [Alphaproteobacteria bacterium SS10]